MKAVGENDQPESRALGGETKQKREASEGDPAKANRLEDFHLLREVVAGCVCMNSPKHGCELVLVSRRMK